MKKKLIVLLTICLLLLPTISLAKDSAVVVILDAKGIDEDSLPTLRRIVAVALEDNGTEVINDQRLDDANTREEQKQITGQLEIDRVYGLEIAPLGKKLMVDLYQMTPDLDEEHHRQFAASSPEELDKIIPRMVRALVNDTSMEDSAQIDTVTVQEGKKWEKRPGEFLWGVGILVGGTFTSDSRAIYGMGLQLSYEMKHVRIDGILQLQGRIVDKNAHNGVLLSKIAIGADYLFMTRNWSPYLGADIGLLIYGNDSVYGADAGATIAAGVEMFRLHSARMLLEFGVTLPFGKPDKPSGFDERDLEPQTNYVVFFNGGLMILW